jgi:para-nitrobenzyl esterase
MDKSNGSNSDGGMGRRAFVGRMSLLAGAAYILPARLEREALAQEAVPGAVIETAGGKLRGTMHNGIHAFKGIPYGASTAGPNRFMAPVKPAPWTGVRDAFKFGPWSPQKMSFSEALAPQGNLADEGMSEDCLVLNVWTPGLNDGGKRPVMVWFHGGGFTSESASWPWVFGESLARRGDAVVVTVNHRLNVVGYLHLGDIGGSKYASSGNAGMLDLVAALQWVRDNITAFGGNPGNVMIFGESGGGRKVCTMMAMPAGKGLFHRAVIQSSSQLRSVPREQGTAMAKALLDVLQITPSRLSEIHNIPIEKIVAAQAEAINRLGTGAPSMGFAPVVDGTILPSHPFDPVATPISANIPVIVGTNTHEQTLGTGGKEEAFRISEADLRQRAERIAGKTDAARVIETYKRVYPDAEPADLWYLMVSEQDRRIDAIQVAERKYAQGGAPIYMYNFDWRSPAYGGRLGACHTIEIPFVFNNTDIPTVMTQGRDVKELAGKTSDAWVAFARTGNPNHKGLPDWPAYNPVHRAVMVFNSTCYVAEDPGSELRKLWIELRAKTSQAG